MAIEGAKVNAGQVDRQTFQIGAMQSRVDQRLRTWRSTEFSRALWGKDYRLWSPKPQPEITNRLGWLTLPDLMQPLAAGIQNFANEVMADGCRHIVLLGMGGSSLAPEVFQHTYGSAPSFPKLLVLDSTHPAAVRSIESKIDIPHTLFLVSSKSGTTLEMLSFFRYFWKKASEAGAAPGRQFVAITDPGTPLEALARERSFRRVFNATPDVGGRYSALTSFGLVPAALIGVDLNRLLDRARIMASACESWDNSSPDPGLSLGAALGELALAGQDKVTFFGSPKLEAFAVWAEQLIAESTGKAGKGILPVADEPIGAPDRYGKDRVFVYSYTDAEPPGPAEAAFREFESAGFPCIRIKLRDEFDLGQEFFRWEIATAAAGAVLGINPFNQPDVESAKDLARKAMAAGSSGDQAAGPSVSTDNLDDLTRALREWSGAMQPGNYVSIQAYLAPTPGTDVTFQELRRLLRDRTKLATTLGYGPRFLHSTGQLHKGGPNTGLFLQIIDDPPADLPVPETDFTFATLIRAQALGDYQALVERGRRVLRINIGGNSSEGLARLTKALYAVLQE